MPRLARRGVAARVVPLTARPEHADVARAFLEAGLLSPADFERTPQGIVRQAVDRLARASGVTTTPLAFSLVEMEDAVEILDLSTEDAPSPDSVLLMVDASNPTLVKWRPRVEQLDRIAPGLGCALYHALSSVMDPLGGVVFDGRAALHAAEYLFWEGNPDESYVLESRMADGEPEEDVRASLVSRADFDEDLPSWALQTVRRVRVRTPPPGLPKQHRLLAEEGLALLAHARALRKWVTPAFQVAFHDSVYPVGLSYILAWSQGDVVCRVIDEEMQRRWSGGGEGETEAAAVYALPRNAASARVWWLTMRRLFERVALGQRIADFLDSESPG